MLILPKAAVTVIKELPESASTHGMDINEFATGYYGYWRLSQTFYDCTDGFLNAFNQSELRLRTQVAFRKIGFIST